MRIARVQSSEGPVEVAFDAEQSLWVERNPRSDSPFTVAHDDAAFCAPCEPLVVVGIAHNPVSSGKQAIQAWFKSPRTVVPNGAKAHLRAGIGALAVEAEIAVVISKSTRGLTEENAHEYVLGVTAVNDVSNVDRTAFDERNFEGKGGEGYTPLGPWIDTELSLENLDLKLEIDGEVVAHTNAAELPSSIAACLAYIARWIELDAGDVVMTGAPFTNRPILPGQVASVIIGEQMRLDTPCVEESPAEWARP
ncbi:fumarylacetoacetate hydrolase family protein [Humidisolicoccus flavus]|uniref:fumarylacetoacetate hydrolase family protein n=1 Tax=Humidisolicoccus flavus TaxID=3111414 RepID=UPI0032457624